LRLSLALLRFLSLTPSCRDIETVSRSQTRLRLFTILRMTVFRRRDGSKWPYRHRRSAALRRIRRVLPRVVWYRGLVLPMCAAELARLTARNVARYGAPLQAERGITPRTQFADVLAMCLSNPGSFPTEYYLYGMHRPESAARASSFANGYEVEAMIALRQPARHLLLGSGFPSENVDLLNNKEHFRDLCLRLGLSVSQSCVVFNRGQAQWTSGTSLPPRDLFVKPLYGGGGYGAARVFFDAATRTYRVEQPKIAVTGAYPAEPLPGEALVAWLTEVSHQIPFIIEPRLTAHPDLAAVVGDRTLPTLRVVTVLDAAGHCGVLYMYLRASMIDSPVDNVSAGGLASLVDQRTGRLGPATTALGQPVARHPLTGRPVEGLAMPFVDQVRASCVAAHAAVAGAQPLLVPVLGWDVAVTADGPTFLEGNPLSDLGIAQKLTGHGAWDDDRFRDGVLSYLAPIDGTPVPLDPGA
jgi:hypothetical protein